MEQEFGPDQADAVADRRVDRVELLRFGDVDHDADRDVVAGPGGKPEPFALARRPRHGVGAGGVEGRPVVGGRVEDDAAGLAVDDGDVVVADIDRADADDHRHAARAGEHGDMAGGAAGEEREAAAAGPVDRQEPARRHILAGKHGAGRRRIVVLARQRPEHPVADIGEVGGAGAEIVVGGRLVVGDLDGDGVRPGGDGVDAFGDRGEGGGGEGVILQHRDLEIEDVGGFAFELFGQRRDRRDRSGDRGFEVGAFAGRVAGRLAPRRARTIEPHDRPGGDPGCGDATAPFNCRPHRLPPRRSPARPVRSGRRRHGRRRCRRRGCGDACPAAPWRPSP